MVLYDKIQKLCYDKGITVTAMCRETGVSRGSITDLKSGRIRSLSAESVARISDYFGVSVGYLMGTESNPIMNCECGEQYNPDDREEVLLHEQHHRKWETAVKKFGFCWPYMKRENIKAEVRTKIAHESLSPEEYFSKQIEIFKALFSRSLEASDYNLSHPDFPTYVSMLLNQERWCRKIPENIYKMLVRQYGTTPGIPTGTYYYVDEKSNAQLFPQERDVAWNIEKLWRDLDIGDTLTLDGDPLTQEAKQSIIDALKLGLAAAKMQNREKKDINK